MANGLSCPVAIDDSVAGITSGAELGAVTAGAGVVVLPASTVGYCVPTGLPTNMSDTVSPTN